MAPALIVLALLSIFPFVYIVLMSLSRVGLIGGIDLHWAGLDNWTRLFSDESVGAAWIRSIVYFVLTVGLEMTLGIGIALLVHSMVWGKNLVLSLLLMPMFMAPGDRRAARALPHRLDLRPLRLGAARDRPLLGRHPRHHDVGLHRGDADGRLGVDAADRPDRAGRACRRCPSR